MITTTFANFQILVPKQAQVIYASTPTGGQPANLGVLDINGAELSTWTLTDSPLPSFGDVQAIYCSAVEVDHIF